ncbi:MAG: sigma-70 family RNA polymerase sigma factor [Leptospiraceae bacterium]|nr:sigma-70 family RNA polymerase sigma factor [Leptospiraceae bacterium]
MDTSEESLVESAPLDAREEAERRLSGLLARSQQGDGEAYRLFLEGVLPVVRRFLGSKIRDADWVEDISQEVLVSIHRARASYDPERPVFPWIHAIAHRRFVDHMRKWSRVSEKEVQGETILEFQAKEDKEHPYLIQEILERAIEKLPPKQKRAVRLLKYDGLSVREAAAKMEMTETAVKVTAHRAYKALRKILEQQEDYENG